MKGTFIKPCAWSEPEDTEDSTQSQDAQRASKNTSIRASSRELLLVDNFRNLYRITVRDQEGKIFDRETRAASLALSVQDLDQQSQIVKVERIHPSTGEVLGGLYNE